MLLLCLGVGMFLVLPQFDTAVVQSLQVRTIRLSMSLIFSLFRCNTFARFVACPGQEPTHQFLVTDLRQECFVDYDHRVVVFGLAIPIMVFYVIGSDPFFTDVSLIYQQQNPLSHCHVEFHWLTISSSGRTRARSAKFLNLPRTSQKKQQRSP